MRIIATTSLILTIAVFSACRTTQRQQEESRRQQWETSLSSRLLELEDKMLALETDLAVNTRKQTELNERMTRLAAGLGDVEADSRKSLTRLEGQINTLREDISKKVNVILEEVARENERLLDRINAARQSSDYAQGYEHVVRGGETLSTIAREYGVTVNAIVEANALTDPNTLRVGQKLFIPQ